MRSGNVCISHGNGMGIRDIIKSHIIFHWKQMFSKHDFTYHFLGFPIRGFNFLNIGNRVLKTLCFPMEMEWGFIISVGFRSISTGEHAVFRTRSPLSIPLGSPMGEVTF